MRKAKGKWAGLGGRRGAHLSMWTVNTAQSETKKKAPRAISRAVLIQGGWRWVGSRGGWVRCSWLRLSLSQRSSGRFRCR